MTMTTYKNTPGIARTIFGRGSFAQLGQVVDDRRTDGQSFAVFLVDNYFADQPLRARVPAQGRDLVLLVDVDPHEPTTQQVDQLRDEILRQGLPVAVVGIGGGSIMDIAKAVALMLTNEGPSKNYQGLNLIKKPGVYHIGVPTISGTGAEVSMTAVLTGPEKKLGLKCQWTVFDQVVLDSELTASVPRNQWFYTGMDTYIHCVESMTGQFKNAYSEAYGYKAMDLCREVYLGPQHGQNPDNDEKLMVASLFGGLSLTYSEVGVCHALSYGLSYVFGTRHCLANCIIFEQLEDYYPEGVREFREMVKKNDIFIPQNLAKDWTDAQIEKMIDVTWALTHMWNHAIGYDWQQKITRADIRRLYERM
jgi:3-deoxy-alpha-D-manno-octulosonate 8-oxidase